MAGSVNHVIIVGNLGRDPEIRSTQDGRRIASLNVATSETWRDKSSGERKEKTEWHKVAVFNDRLVDVAEKYLRKGSKIYITGQLQSRKWIDQQGNDRYTTEIVLSQFRGEIVMLDKAEGNGNRAPPTDSQEDYGQTRTRESSGSGPGYAARHNNPSAIGGHRNTNVDEDLDDSIPFATSSVDQEPYLRRKASPIC